MSGSKTTNSGTGNPAPARPVKPFEPEGQLILRLPGPAADLIRIALSSPKDMLKERLKIDMKPDMRHAKVYVDSMEFDAKLVDLPCIIESHKTVDKKTFYKTGDICQMLLVSEDMPVDPDSEEQKNPDRPEDLLNKDKRYQWRHGITPPLKNVRKGRFRKTLKRKDAELQEIENELKRLLRADSEAVNVKWEVVTEEDMKESLKTMSENGELDSISEAGPSRKLFSRSLAEHDIFGDIVSSSDEENGMAADNVDMNEENNMALDFLD